MRGTLLAAGAGLLLLMLCGVRLPFDAVLARLDDLFDRLRNRRMRDALVAVFLLLPAIVILGVFGVAPLFAAVHMSLFNIQRGIVKSFVGLQNYQTALFPSAGELTAAGGSSFGNSFLITAYYAAGTIPVAMLLSFVIAGCLFRIARARGFFRTVYFLPYVTSAVAAAMVWGFLLNADFGLANVLLTRLGCEPQRWLLEPHGVLYLLSGGRIPTNIGPSLALCCVILFEIWHSSGFMIVIFLAGLSAVPRELEEAARIDGANVWQATWRITVPLLSPTIFFLAVVSVIKSFQAFNGFYALTGNGSGPLNTTQNLTVYIYANFYEFGKWGYGAAAATLLCLAIVGLTMLQWWTVGRKVHYE